MIRKSQVSYRLKYDFDEKKKERKKKTLDAYQNSNDNTIGAPGKLSTRQI
jgi:hypothetical protein